MLILFQPILASNEARMACFNFLNIFYFFWNFLLLVRNERNGLIIFIFSLSHPFSNLFLLQMKPEWYFFNFFGISLKFSIALRVRTERNDYFYFLSFPSFSNLFRLKWNQNGFFFLFFWKFLLFFWNFFLRVWQE